MEAQVIDFAKAAKKVEKARKAAAGRAPKVSKKLAKFWQRRDAVRMTARVSL